MRKLLLAVAMIALPLAATSQTGTAPSGSERFLSGLPDGATRLSKVIGVEVLGADVHRLGTIDDLVLDRKGTITAVVISTGGFLGLGEKKVAVPYEALLWNYDVAPTAGPSSSNTGNPALAGRQELQTRPAATTGPGPENPQATGTVGDPAAPAEGLRPQGATVPVTGGGAPVRAVLRLSAEELRNAPEFKGGR